jgi:hypothetical protein
MKRVPLTTTVEITVRFSAGAHVTNTVLGVRASSTSSAQRAADAFGEKYFGKGFVKALELRGSDAGSSRFAVVGTNADPLSAQRQRRSS